MRIVLIAAGMLLLVPTLGFAIQAGWATWLWPWPDGALSYLFVGSILAAVALPVTWIGVTGELAAMRAGALNLAVACAGMSGYLLFFHANPDGPEPTIHGWVLGLAALLNLFIYGYSRQRSFMDTRPVPRPVRGSFLLFALVLIGVSAALLARSPHVFPWPLQPGTSVLIGWIFLGAAVYFLHGFIWPGWGNAAGQLLGFLAYDLVLLGPYLVHFGNVAPAHLPSLVVYCTILIYSLLLASYYLFVHPTTRGIAAVERA